MKNNLFAKEGLARSLFTAHIIVLLHILILAGVGLTVVLFRGVYLYLPWIMGGIGLLVLLAAWFFYHRMKAGAADIQKIMTMPQFQDRSVEIKLLGGLASFKMGEPTTRKIPEDHQLTHAPPTVLLEQKSENTENTLDALTALYEQDLISKEDFERAKQKIIQG